MESLYKLLQKQEPLKQKKFKTTTKKLIERATMKPSVDAGADAGAAAAAGCWLLAAGCWRRRRRLRRRQRTGRWRRTGRRG